MRTPRGRVYLSALADGPGKPPHPERDRKSTASATRRLAAAVWTRDVAKAHHLAAKLKAGTVWVNCYDVFDAAAPFGGLKNSGLGREGGVEGIAEYLSSTYTLVSR